MSEFMRKPTNNEHTTFFSIMDSPIDPLLLYGDGKYLQGVLMDGDKSKLFQQPNWVRDDKKFKDTKQQLDSYFAGKLTEFSLPLDLKGTEFQRKVWAGLQTIDHGKTASYLDLAKHIKSPKAVRAVGLANGRNPIAIIVPCHRVIGSNGKLTGYAGGLARKQWLLEHEASQTGLFANN